MSPSVSQAPARPRPDPRRPVLGGRHGDQQAGRRRDPAPHAPPRPARRQRRVPVPGRAPPRRAPARRPRRPAARPPRAAQPGPGLCAEPARPRPDQRQPVGPALGAGARPDPGPGGAAAGRAARDRGRGAVGDRRRWTRRRPLRSRRHRARSRGSCSRSPASPAAPSIPSPPVAGCRVRTRRSASSSRSRRTRSGSPSCSWSSLRSEASRCCRLRSRSAGIASTVVSGARLLRPCLRVLPRGPASGLGIGRCDVLLPDPGVRRGGRVGVRRPARAAPVGGRDRGGDRGRGGHDAEPRPLGRRRPLRVECRRAMLVTFGSGDVSFGGEYLSVGLIQSWLRCFVRTTPPAAPPKRPASLHSTPLEVPDVD